MASECLPASHQQCDYYLLRYILLESLILQNAVRTAFGTKTTDHLPASKFQEWTENFIFHPSCYISFPTYINLSHFILPTHTHPS